MNTWITLIGQKPMAAVNTLWAALREEQVKPLEKLIVFYPQDMKKNLLLFTKWAELLFTEYLNHEPRLKVIEFPKDDIKTFRGLLKQTIREIDSDIFMDLTSGKKAMSSLMLLMGDLFSGKVKKVYYSFLKDEDYMDFPYPTIPLNTSELFNLLEK